MYIQHINDYKSRRKVDVISQINKAYQVKELLLRNYLVKESLLGKFENVEFQQIPMEHMLRMTSHQNLQALLEK